MITTEMYFGAKPHTPEQAEAASDLLVKINALLHELAWDYPCDPDTGTPISGSRGGAGDGGFRLGSSTTGRAGSKHKSAHAVDVYDPEGALDGALGDALLGQHGLYRESPDDTPGWCHLQDVAPGSGRRTFKP